MEKFDAIIIGSGQAGNPLAKRLSREGLRVALLESAYIGGTCINYGCTPTKTLVGVAKVISQAQKAEDYGVTRGRQGLRYDLIHRRKDQVVADFRGGMENSLLKDPHITLFHGKGSFSGNKEIRVSIEGRGYISLTAPLIFINTGTRARIPDIAGLRSVPFLTAKTILELEDLPEHLLIIGGGYIALEFAQIYRRMGSSVTILEQSPALLPKEDDDVGRAIQEILEAEGVEMITGATVKSVKTDRAGRIHIAGLAGGGSRSFTGSHLLVAAGTVPNTGDLDLSKTGIRVDEEGFVVVDENLETTEAGVYALGDVKGGPAFTQVSYHDYLVVADHLFGKDALSARNRLIPYCLFTDPELGRVGLTEKEAVKAGLDFSVAKMGSSYIARAVESGETSGFLKALVDRKTGKILGAAVVCAGGGELMSLLQVAMMGGIRYDQLRDGMFAHPTYAEAVNNLFSTQHLKTGGL